MLFQINNLVLGMLLLKKMHMLLTILTYENSNITVIVIF